MVVWYVPIIVIERQCCGLAYLAVFIRSFLRHGRALAGYAASFYFAAIFLVLVIYSMIPG